MRRARFTVSAPGDRFDGATSCTVLIEQDGPHTLVRVRPYRRRREFILTLAAVAQKVIWQVARVEADEKRRAKKTFRRRKNGP